MSNADEPGGWQPDRGSHGPEAEPPDDKYSGARAAGSQPAEHGPSSAGEQPGQQYAQPGPWPPGPYWPGGQYGQQPPAGQPGQGYGQPPGQGYEQPPGQGYEQPPRRPPHGPPGGGYGPPGQPYGSAPGGMGQPYFGTDPFGGAAAPARSRTPMILAIVAGVVVLVVIIGVVIGVASRTTVFDQTALQNGVQGVLTKNYGVQATAVTCPADEKVSQGATFTCEATIDGDQKPVKITVTDDAGTYQVARP